MVSYVITFKRLQEKKKNEKQSSMMAYESQYMARSSTNSSNPITVDTNDNSVDLSAGTPESGTTLDFSEEARVVAVTDHSPNRLIISAEKRKRKQVNCLENLKEVCLQIGTDMKSRMNSRESKEEVKRLKEKRKIMEVELRKVEKEKELELIKAKRVKGEIIALWLQQGHDLSSLPEDLM